MVDMVKAIPTPKQVWFSHTKVSAAELHCTSLNRLFERDAGIIYCQGAASMIAPWVCHVHIKNHVSSNTR